MYFNTLIKVFLDRLDLISNITKLIILSNFVLDPKLYDTTLNISRILITKDKNFIENIKKKLGITSEDKDLPQAFDMKNHMEDKNLNLRYSISINKPGSLTFKNQSFAKICDFHQIEKIVKKEKIKTGAFGLQIDFELKCGVNKVVKRFISLNPSETLVIVPTIKEMKELLKEKVEEKKAENNEETKPKLTLRSQSEIEIIEQMQNELKKKEEGDTSHTKSRDEMKPKHKKQIDPREIALGLSWGD